MSITQINKRHATTCVFTWSKFLAYKPLRLREKDWKGNELASIRPRLSGKLWRLPALWRKNNRAVRNAGLHSRDTPAEQRHPPIPFENTAADKYRKRTKSKIGARVIHTIFFAWQRYQVEWWLLWFRGFLHNKGIKPFERKTESSWKRSISFFCMYFNKSSLAGETCHITHLFPYFSLFCNRTALRKFFLFVLRFPGNKINTHCGAPAISKVVYCHTQY